MVLSSSCFASSSDSVSASYSCCYYCSSVSSCHHDSSASLLSTFLLLVASFHSQYDFVCFCYSASSSSCYYHSSASCSSAASSCDRQLLLVIIVFVIILLVLLLFLLILAVVCYSVSSYCASSASVSCVSSVFLLPESVVKGLTTEVVVASYDSNSLNVIVLISAYFFFVNLLYFKAEGKAIETTGALPWRYRGGGFETGKMRFCHGGNRKVTTLSVFAGVRRCSRGCRGTKNSFGTSSIRK